MGMVTRTLIRASSAPVARYRPSGLKLTLRMYMSPVLLKALSARTLRLKISFAW